MQPVVFVGLNANAFERTGHLAPEFTIPRGESHARNEARAGIHEEHRASPKKVGATRDVRSLTRQRLRKTPEKPTGLCPYPFPFQIWFDWDAVRARSASRRKRGGS